MIASSILRAGFVVIVAIVLSGCTLHQYSEEAPVRTASTGQDHHGYALLHSMLGDEKDVDKLLIVKRERAELRDLIKSISNTAGNAHRQLENSFKADRSFSPRAQGLPPAESATRSAIARTRGKEL